MSAWSATLGPLNLMSEFGQPLRAVVEITDVAPGERLLVEASIAPLDTYMSLGLPYPDSLRGSTVRVLSLNDGRWILRISGVNPVEEKDFNMVLALDTSAGRQVRNYRLTHDGAGKEGVTPTDLTAQVPMLEPGPAAPDPVAAVALPEVAPTPLPAAGEAAVAAEVSPALQPQELAQPESLPPAAPGAPEGAEALLVPAARLASEDAIPAAASDAPVDPAGDATPQPPKRAPAPVTPHTLTVAPGETAASLAERIKTPEVSAEQALLALYRLNVEMFEGNIHRLRAGTLLQVPTVDQMIAVPAARAREELQTLKHADAPAVGQGRDQLRLSHGGKGGSKAAAGGGGSSESESAVQAVAINSAMTEVQSRIKQLESIVSSLNSLIAAREQQVAKVQAEIAAMGVPSTTLGLDQTPAQAAPTASEDGASETAASGGALGSANATLLRATTEEEAALQTALAVEENSVPTWVKILAGVAAVSLLLAVLLPFFYMRRRRAMAESDADMDEEEERFL